MGGGENEITISAVMDAVGFQKGSKELEKAIRGVANTAKRLTGTIIGIGSAYQILSKAVNAYMAQNEKLSQQMNSIWTALGNVLGPIIEQIINWVTTAVSYFLEFLRLLGITSKTASQLSKSAKGAGSELKKTIAGFDELNLLNGGGGGGGGGATLKDVDPADWMKKLADLIKNKMWDQATDLIVEKMNQAIAAFRKKAAEFGDVVGEWLDDVLHMIARIINEVNWEEIGEGIAEFFNNAFRDVDGEDIGTILVAKITIALRIVLGFLETLDWGQVGEILSGAVVGAIESIGSAIENADWKKIGNGIRKFFENINWEEIKDAIFVGLETAWNSAVDLLWGVMDGASEEEPPLVASLRGLGDSLSGLIEAIEGFASDAWEGTLKPILEWGEDVGLPTVLEALNTIIVAITGFIEEHGPFILTFLEELGLIAAGLGLVKALTALWAVLMANPITIVVVAVAAFIAALVEAYQKNEDFRKQVDTAWNMVKRVVVTVGRGIRDVVVGIITKIHEFIQSWIDWQQGFVDGFGKVYDTISTFDIAGWFNDLVDSALEWGSDLIGNFINGIVSAVGGLWDTIGGIAEGIWEWLHFSEPEKGPLADFHTWAPDMMNTFADGIKQNEGKVIGAVGGLAGDISDAMNGGDFGLGQINVSGIDGVMNGFADKIVGGFENLIDRLQAIADNVVFTMPAIAEGSIVPYGVSGGVTGGASGGGNADLEALVTQLMDLISDFRDSVENMQWVARFGNVQAVVQEISRIQKQNERARG